jgi:multiple sugar transport system substrate-binding protein
MNSRAESIVGTKAWSMQSKRDGSFWLFCAPLISSRRLFGKQTKPSRLPRFPNLMRRCAISSLFLSLLAMPAIGCGSKATTSNPQDAKPFDGVALKIACPSGPSADVLNRFAPGWARRNGAQVEVVLYEPTNSPPSGEQADVWVLPPWRLGRLAAAGDLLPVPEMYTRRTSPTWTRILPVYRDQLLLWGQTVYALPLLGESPLCVYRTDLFKDAGLPPPTTWQDVEKATRYFHDHAPAGIQGGCLPPLPQDDDGLDREFFAVAAPLARRGAREDDRMPTSEAEMFSFQYDLETGKPRISEPGFVEALSLLQRLHSDRKPGTSIVPPEAFHAGQAVFCLANAAWVARFQEKDSPVRNKFEILQPPGSTIFYSFRTGQPQKMDGINRVPYLGAGGWLAAVPKTTTHADAAFALLADLTGVDTSREIVSNPRWDGGPTRDEHLNTPEIWNSYGLNAEQRNRLIEEIRQTVTFPGLKNPAFRLRTPDEAEHRKVLLEAVRAALLEGKDAAEALKGVAQRWEELDQSIPLKQRIADYRRSLGLR